MFDSFRNMDDFLSLLGIEWAWQNIFGQPIGIDKNKKFVVTIFSLHLIMPQTWLKTVGSTVLGVCGRYSGRGLFSEQTCAANDDKESKSEISVRPYEL